MNAGARPHGEAGPGEDGSLPEGRLGSSCLVIHSGCDGERGGDDLAAAESELSPQPVGAGRVEVDVYGQIGPECSAGERENRGAGAVADIGVLVGEGLPVGAHDDDVAGGGQVGLEVVK